MYGKQFHMKKCYITVFLTRAGPLLAAERAGPGVFEHLPLTRLLGHVATRGKRHSKEHKKIIKKLL